jgi:hypothetical protein
MRRGSGIARSSPRIYGCLEVLASASNGRRRVVREILFAELSALRLIPLGESTVPTSFCAERSERMPDSQLCIDTLTTDELLRIYAGVMRQLRSRGVIRSSNNPVSDIAEWLGSQAFGLTLATNSVKSYDAVAADGTRYQIKGRRITPDNPSTQLSVVRDLASGGFDFLLALYFDEDFALTRAFRISHSCVVQHSLWSKAQGGHVLHAKRALLADERCEPVLSRFADVVLPDRVRDVGPVGG